MKIQSNGMGMQSVAMYLMSCLGELPRLDYSIFADPGREKEKTYEYIEWLKDWSGKNNGIPLIIDDSKNLYKDLLKGTNSTNNRLASLPAYTKNKDGSTGMLRRQCTSEYKINVVEKNIRKILDIEKGKSYPSEIQLWIGISMDEFKRVSIPERKNLTFVYPFCNYYRNRKRGWFGSFESLRRSDLYSWYKKHGFPIPPKSSCVFCPFQSDKNWLDMKKEGGQDWKDAVKIDKAIRNSSKRGIKEPIYLHDSTKPLDQVDLNENQTEIKYNCTSFCDI